MVRVPVVHKHHKGYLQQWSTETHKVQENHHDGIYRVDGKLYARKDLQLVTGTVIKQPEKPAHEKQKQEKEEKIGKAQYAPELKDFLGWKKATKASVAAAIDSKLELRKKRPVQYSK